jgi:hypothetical protein
MHKNYNVMRTKILVSNVIILLLVLKTCVSFGQSLSLNWSQQISTSGWDWVNKIIGGDEHSYIIIGGLPRNIIDSTVVNQTGASDSYVACFDSVGTLLWQKSFGSRLFDNAQDAILLKNRIYVSGLYQDTIIEGSFTLKPSTYLGAYLSQISLAGEVQNIWSVNNISSVSNFLITSNNSDKIIGAYKCSELYAEDSTICYKTDSNRIVITTIDTLGIQLIEMQIQSKGNITLTSLNFYNNKIYLTGSFSDTLIVKDSIYSSSGLDDAFIICLNNEFEPVWVKIYGGNGMDKLESMSFDHVENIILTGTFEETSFFDSFLLTSDGSTDVFVLQIDTTGIIKWIRQISGLANEEAYCITINSNNDIYVLGSFRNNIKFTSYPLAPGYQEYFSESGFGNLFLSVYNNYGDLIFSYVLPGASEDFGKSILVDSSDNLIIAGNFNIAVTIPNINSDAPALNLESIGDHDIFVAKFADPCSNMKLDLSQDTVICKGSSILLDAGNGFDSYTWSTGEHKQIITAKKQGVYTVVVTNYSGCMKKDSVEINLIPDPIVFAGNDTTVIADYFIPNKANETNCEKFYWRCNGAGTLLYSDSIRPIYFPTQSERKGGEVELSLTGQNSCNTIQSSIKIKFIIGNSSFLVYPNPTHDFIKVTSLNRNEIIESIELYTNKGTVLTKWQNINNLEFILNVSGISPGMYHLLINSSDQKENAPFVIIGNNSR